LQEEPIYLLEGIQDFMNMLRAYEVITGSFGQPKGAKLLNHFFILPLSLLKPRILSSPTVPLSWSIFFFEEAIAMKGGKANLKAVKNQGARKDATKMNLDHPNVLDEGGKKKMMVNGIL